MTAELVPVTFNKIMQSRSYTVIILGTEEKQFAIYADPQVGRQIQASLAMEKKLRPMTHELIRSVFEGLGIKPLQIVIADIEDTVYFARLYLEQEIEGKKTILEIDARPSDCMILALQSQVPLFCKRELFDKVVPVKEF